MACLVKEFHLKKVVDEHIVYTLLSDDTLTAQQ